MVNTEGDTSEYTKGKYRKNDTTKMRVWSKIIIIIINFLWVLRFASTLLIQTIITPLDLELYQIKIQIAFLNGKMNEKIYVDQLTCFMAAK